MNPITSKYKNKMYMLAGIKQLQYSEKFLIKWTNKQKTKTKKKNNNNKKNQGTQNKQLKNNPSFGDAKYG